MNFTSFPELINNLTFLLSVAFIFDLATGRWKEQTLYRKVLTGLFLGFMGIIAMLIPWTFQPGVMFDTRSILLGISGLFFGWLPTVIAMAMTSGFRIYLGGSGVLVGVSVILASGIIGIYWRFFCRCSLSRIPWFKLLLMGLVIHMVMLGLMFLLPMETALAVASNMALPLLTIFPLGTVLLGMLMSNRVKRQETESMLRESENFAVSVIDALTDHIAVLDEKGTIIAVNKAWNDFAAANPPVGQNVGVGANYLAVCDAAQGDDRDQAQEFARGMKAVMKGEKSSFFLEYPCHSPSEKRWFLGRVTPFRGHEPMRIVVAHENITDRKQMEQILMLYQGRLEELVKDRTFELEEKNRELLKEISRRKNAEKAIAESEEHYRTLVELTPGITYRIKADGIIDFISSGISQLGYEPEELIGTPLADILHPDDRERVRNILVERRTGKRRITDLDVRFLHKSQGTENYSLNYSFVQLSARGYWNVPDSEIFQSDKEFLFTLGIASDITARKHAEHALRENERKLALLKEVATAANAAPTVDDVLQAAVDGISRFISWPVGHVYISDGNDSDLMIPTHIWHLENKRRYGPLVDITMKTEFNPGVGMVGGVVETKKTYWIEDVATHSDYPRLKQAGDVGVHGAFAFPVIVNGKVSAVLEFFSPHKEKPSLSLMSLMDEIGVQLGIVLERKQSEKELRKLSRAVEQSPATVVITDIEGKIQYVNPKFSELTGYSSAEVLGKNPRLLSSGVHPRSFYKKLWNTILSGQNWYGTFCNRGKNGEIYWEKASISPVRDENGQITNFVAVKEDITKLLKYEEELKQAKEDAESANKAKSDFLASMSHELRTPLNAVIGFSEVLKEQYFGPLNQKQDEYVEDILESGKYLLSLINDILDLSKVEAGKMELELSRFKITDLVSNSLVLIREKAKKHSLVLNTNIDSKLEDIEINADERKIKQVLFNLLSNAAKFTPDRGTILVEAKAAPDHDFLSEDESIAGRKAGGIFVEISVTDTGLGIPQEEQEKIFEPFYQSKGSRQGKTSGTGLGLPLCRKMVELHGGRIWVESRGEGKGSRFAFTIPAEQQGSVPEFRQ